MDLSDILGDEEGLYRCVALICATITTGEAKEKTKRKMADHSQHTMAVAQSYLEFIDDLAADLPPMPELGKAA